MKEVLTKIKPSAEEKKRFNQIIHGFLSKLNSKLKSLKIDAKAIIGGSGAKGTWLSGGHDVDVFVQFNYKKFSDKSPLLSNFLEAALKKAFPHYRISRVHGSRDYFQFRYETLDFEMIPILNIKKAEKAKNITDVSPLHTRWVKRNTSAKLKDEVRLAKQFFRANGLYGAESYISGFSGYVLEILIVNYGSLENLLKASTSWKIKQVIDVEEHHKGKDALFELNKSKTISPLIVIDPVDKSRNAAAALSQEKFSLLRKISQQYLKHPQESFFEKEALDSKQLKKEAEKRKLNFIFLTLIPQQGKEDVVGIKLLKAFNFLENELQAFDVKNSGWDWNKHNQAWFYFFLGKKQLPAFEVRKGPPIKFKEHAEKFRKQHPDAYEEEERLITDVEVKYRELDKFLYHILNEPYFKERIKEVRKMEKC